VLAVVDAHLNAAVGPDGAEPEGIQPDESTILDEGTDAMGGAQATSVFDEVDALVLPRRVVEITRNAVRRWQEFCSRGGAGAALQRREARRRDTFALANDAAFRDAAQSLEGVVRDITAAAEASAWRRIADAIDECTSDAAMKQSSTSLVREHSTSATDAAIAAADDDGEWPEQGMDSDAARTPVPSATVSSRSAAVTLALSEGRWKVQWRGM
jgi:hypothetical protein